MMIKNLVSKIPFGLIIPFLILLGIILTVIGILTKYIKTAFLIISFN